MTAAVRFRPRDLPELTPFLDGLGLGAIEPATVTSFIGRNDNWAGSTTTGHGVFVKRILRSPGFDRFDRSVSFEALRRRAADPPPAPTCLGWDAATGLMAFTLVPDCRSAAELATDGHFDTTLAERAGAVTARVHAMPVDGVEVDTSAAPLPELSWLWALPWELVEHSSAAQLEALRLMQDDPEVVAALHRLRAVERAAAPHPVHGDLRLDQFLVADGRVILSDWEEFRLGDPARDLGAFAGECLYQAAVGIVGPAPADIVARGADGLRRQRPIVEAFCAGYRRHRPIDDDTAVRAAAFAGWHLFDRLHMSGREQSRLSAVHRAAAGVGRTLLLRPDAFTERLGLR